MEIGKYFKFREEIKSRCQDLKGKAKLFHKKCKCSNTHIRTAQTPQR